MARAATVKALSKVLRGSRGSSVLLAQCPPSSLPTGLHGTDMVHLQEHCGSSSSDSPSFGLLAGAFALASLGLLSTPLSVAHADAATLPPLSSDEDNPQNSDSFSLLPDSVRRRIFFKYEKRIRLRSPPRKVFEYFASVKTSNGQMFMTHGDLMRSIVPVFPPSESSIIREGSLQGERSPGDLHCPPSDFFMLFDTNGDGLISFPEYIFFLTLLTIPEQSFSVAFRMFDLDGNGTIDKEEFKKVMAYLKSQSRQAKVQHETFLKILKVVDDEEDKGLVEWFFGKDGQKLLPVEKFESFLKELHEEITRLEFSHYDYLQKGTISAKNFGLSLVAAADLSRINSYLDRVDELGREECFKDIKISFEEFRQFSELRKKVSTLSFAILSYGEVSGVLTKADLQRAASQVCNTPISDEVINIVFYIFDTNRDGNLSTDEFLGVMQRREYDLIEPADSGIVRLFKCMWNCL